MKSRIGKMEWILLYFTAGLTDIVQILIDLTGVGVAVNEAADPIIGGILLAYFQLRGVSMFSRISRVLSLFGVTGLEELTGGIAPAWIIDIWYIHRSVMIEKAEYAQQTEDLVGNRPLNKDGIRLPESANNMALNKAGVRQPSDENGKIE